MPNKEGRLMRYCIARWNEQKNNTSLLRGKSIQQKKKPKHWQKSITKAGKLSLNKIVQKIVNNNMSNKKFIL